jgi:hypothetical protein
MQAKRFLSLFVFFSLLEGILGNEARMVMSCTSVSVPPVSTRQSGQTYVLGFTTADDGSINNELYQSIGNTTYESAALLLVPGFADPLVFDFTVDLPNTGDSDLNLLTDFFEVARPIASQVTSGELIFDDGMDVTRGQVTATWNRAAGSTKGTVQFRLNIDDLAIRDLRFNHPFEIFEYQGNLTYTVSGTNINAAVDLTRQGAATDKFTGPFHMTRRNTAELDRNESDWFGPADESFTVLSSTAIDGAELLLTRGATGTNYYGSFYFRDGIPSTPFENEFDLWDVQIFDPNDANKNHIPDLSDEPGGVQPATPVAVLTVTGGQLKLKITAKAGQPIVVEQRSDLGASNWIQVDARTLTADTEELPLTPPGTGNLFYRVRTP